MFGFTIRQLMLFMLCVAVAIVVVPLIDRQILWLRMHNQHAKCVQFSREYFELTGRGVCCIPCPPGEIPDINRDPGYWQKRANLVSQLEYQTSHAKELENIVKWERKRRLPAAPSRSWLSRMMP